MDDSRAQVWMTAQQAAAVLGVTSQTVYNLIARGDLDSDDEVVQTNTRRRVRAESVYLAAARRAAAAYAAEGRTAHPTQVPGPAGDSGASLETPLATDLRLPASGTLDQLVALLGDATARAAAAEARATAAEARLGGYVERVATLEAVISFRATSDDEQRAALQLCTEAQQHLSRSAAAERAAADQLLHTYPAAR